MQDFRKLVVWQRNHAVTLAIYKATGVFSRNELFGLTSQMRRAAISVGANIAEGTGRGSDADFARFVQFAIGSTCELENYVLIARDLAYLLPSAASELEQGVIEVRRMLTPLMRRLRGPGS